MTIIILLILVIIYFSIDISLRRKLQTKPRKGFFHNNWEGRNRFFLISEIVLIIVFTISIFAGINTIPAYIIIFIYFFTLNILRGTEEWLFKRQQKEYYHTWLAACFFLIGFILLLSEK
ncbi:DUF4181 domain-containing protein [Alteribacillus sp. YIM 98480]|uniref:DUF4181 domain-containing protein n=1 Tax=Alteribacillus sp. YIM 98480 TaxID=2606599 RepID=UPI00131A8359